jgi:transposase InsO family protein
MAIKQRKGKETPLIHHSDRGLQYCANDYQNTLNKKKRNIAKYDTKL